MFWGIVALAGSRALPPGGASLVGCVVRDLLGSGCTLVCGCCIGADETVLRTASPGSVRVLAAFGPGGLGSCSLSAVNAIASHSHCVTWWSGGGSLVPLRVRLVRRTQAVVSAASAGLVVFPSSPTSRGSWLAARLAVGRGLPVVVFPLGFRASLLPSFGAGSWVRVSGSGFWFLAWRWMPIKNEKLFNS